MQVNEPMTTPIFKVLRAISISLIRTLKKSPSIGTSSGFNIFYTMHINEPMTAPTSLRRAARFFEFVKYEALAAIRGDGARTQNDIVRGLG